MFELILNGGQFPPTHPVPKQCSISDFLLSTQEWLAFVKCIAGDNAEELRALSKTFNWEDFLRSSDVSGAWAECSTDLPHALRVGNLNHPLPTNPFFVAIFYNARKCLAFMHDSCVDFSSITEHGFTAYHILLSAIRFMSDEHTGETAAAAAAQVSDECKELLSLFHHTLFTREQQQQMLNSVCRFGMSPLSWGVFLGLANHVEYIMRYYSPDTCVHSDAYSLNEQVTFDVSDMVGENPRFYISPLCVFLDLYGQSDLAEIKALGIFRTGFIWRQWTETLYKRNRYLAGILLTNASLLTLATVFVVGAGVNDYLKARCSMEPFSYPLGVIIILSYWLVFATLGIIGSVHSMRRKELYRRQAGYPSWPRKAYVDMLFWFLPWTLVIPLSSFLLWMYVDAERSCRLFGQLIYSVSGCCVLLLLLLSVSLIVAYLRLVPHLTTLMSSFYKSIGTFAVFVMLYITLTGAFTRMFQSRLLNVTSSSSSSSSSGFVGNGTAPQDVNQVTDFLKAFYLTFLVSLSIVDTSVFVPASDRVDLNIAHILFIMFVPILFINFVIGLLTSVVAHVHEHSVENKYLLMLSVAEFAEMTLASFRSAKNESSPEGSQRPSIGICEPMRLHSKLIATNRDTLASLCGAK